MATLLDGKMAAQTIRDTLAKRITKLKEKPCLAIVTVGNDPASAVYVGGKEKACKEVGITCVRHKLSEKTTQNDLLELVAQLNNDTKIHGYIVQLPLPKHIDEQLIIDSISPLKDVDGFSPINLGNLVIGKYMFTPATPKGIITLIESSGVKTDGKNAVVVGRSNIVGKPIALLLLEKNCTVTICHSKTKHLENYTKEADILVAAVGRAGTIKGDMVKKGAVVIDVGINRLPSGTIVGDCDFDSVSQVAGFITPVPGGVGPMTIASLLENTLRAYELQKNA